MNRPFRFLTLLLLCAVPAAAQLEKLDGKPTATYDRFTDEVTIRAMVRVQGEGFEGLGMMATYKYKPSELKGFLMLQEGMRKESKRQFSSEWFKNIAFGLISVSKERQFRETDTFIILADGKRWEPAAFPAHDVSPKMKIVTEAFVATISAEDLIKICKAEKVEVRLGSREFELTREQLHPLRIVATNLILQSQGQQGVITIEGQ